MYINVTRQASQGTATPPSEATASYLRKQKSVLGPSSPTPSDNSTSSCHYSLPLATTQLPVIGAMLVKNICCLSSQTRIIRVVILLWMARSMQIFMADHQVLEETTKNAMVCGAGMAPTTNTRTGFHPCYGLESVVYRSVVTNPTIVCQDMDQNWY